jgi:hypothetical protein
VAERLPRRDAIPHTLFELGELRKAALLAPAPDALLSGIHLEDPAFAWHERNLPDLFGEGGEQLLRNPGGAPEEAAARAIPDLDSSELS